MLIQQFILVYQQTNELIKHLKSHAYLYKHDMFVALKVGAFASLVR